MSEFDLDRSKVPFYIFKSKDFCKNSNKFSKIDLQNNFKLQFNNINCKKCSFKDGSVFGIIIGDFFSDRVFQEKRFIIFDDIGTDSIDDYIENNIYKNSSGSFVFILNLDENFRIYLDACGTIPICFNAKEDAISCSPAICVSDGEFENDFKSEIFDRLDVSRDGWFTAGLTAYPQVARLLANHYLDVQTMNVTRHWPKVKHFDRRTQTESLEAIDSILAANIGRYLAAGKCLFALTGGHETRLLLAYVKHNLSKVTFINHYNNEHALDTVIAKKITSKFNLNTIFNLVRIATPEETRQWVNINGRCVGGINQYNHTTERSISGYDFFVGGLGGEVGRGFFWRSSDGPDSISDLPRLLSALALPKCEETSIAVSRWISDVPLRDSRDVLDLAYLELRMSTWAFPQFSGSVFSGRHAHPIISRDMFEEFFQMRPELRMNANYIKELIKIRWPEVIEIPINHISWLDTKLRLLVRVLKRPSLVVRKLRRSGV